MSVNLWGRVMAAYQAFREPYLITDPLSDVESDFNSWDARRFRYALYWSFYENTVYRKIHDWATRYKIEYGLYRWTRSIYNPSYRVGEFWKSNLWGGELNRFAKEQGALPIITENEALREPIAQIWDWSNWASRKDVVTLQGAVLGDIILMVTDDIEREKVYIEPIHPGKVKEVLLDGFGNVKNYTIEEVRLDPSSKDRTVTYTEIAERDGDNVVYRTFLNGVPYAWDGDEVEWTRPYGFIPMVLIKHNDVGLNWGWSEIHAMRSRIHEIDDISSKLSDQIRKMVDAPWLFAGVNKPTSTPEVSHTSLIGAAAVDRPFPGREELPALYGPTGASATPLIAPLDIAATTEYLRDLLADIEENLPELSTSRNARAAVADKSGKAVREARRDATTKVLQRRVNYDNGLIRAHQMAIAIGGLNGYFPGFGLDSYAGGQLAHYIGQRPVFDNDPIDQIEIDSARLDALQAPIITRWRQLGYTDEEINQMLEDNRRGEDEMVNGDFVTGVSQ